MALSASLALPVSTARADAPDTRSSLNIVVEGLRNARGHVLICVTSNAAAFPDCSRDPQSMRLRVPTAQVRGDMVLALHGEGTYAVAIVHDENSNGRLDTMMMMPREGFGFSRNPRLRMGPPRFADASFAVPTGQVRQAVRVRYML